MWSYFCVFSVFSTIIFLTFFSYPQRRPQFTQIFLLKNLIFFVRNLFIFSRTIIIIIIIIEMGFFHFLVRLLKSQAIPIAKSIFKAYKHTTRSARPAGTTLQILRQTIYHRLILEGILDQIQHCCPSSWP